jgi:hypothetical protein
LLALGPAAAIAVAARRAYGTTVSDSIGARRFLYVQPLGDELPATIRRW